MIDAVEVGAPEVRARDVGGDRLDLGPVEEGTEPRPRPLRIMDEEREARAEAIAIRGREEGAEDVEGDHARRARDEDPSAGELLPGELGLGDLRAVGREARGVARRDHSAPAFAPKAFSSSMRVKKVRAT